MKKIFAVFALLSALFFAVGCGGGSKNDNDSVTNFGKLGYECYPNKTCDEGLLCDTDNNVCVKDTGNQTNDSDNGDTTPDEGDSQPDGTDTEPDGSDSQPDGADTEPDESDSQPDDADTEPDESDSQPDDADPTSDDVDPQSDDDADSAPELTEAEKCGAAGGTWNATEGTCTKTTECTGKPENAEWNGAFSYKQTYTDGAWSAEIPAEYDTEEGVCHYKCARDSVWNQQGCAKLTPCGEYSTILCYDSENDLIWSGTDDSKTWEEAEDHCEHYSDEILGDDWRLPTISELRTLVQNCPATQMPPVEGIDTCGVREDSGVTCLAKSCQGANCYSCPDDYNIEYSKFGDRYCLWSSSLLSDDSNYAWFVGFDYGAGVSYNDINNYCDVRCVK